MGLFNKLFNRKKENGYTLKLVTETGNGFFSFNGKLYESDVVRSCIRPQSRAVGKLTGKHVRKVKEEIKINPDVYMRFLLEDPNPYMSGQMFQEKMSNQLELNNNAFALIVRDENGYPTQLYPIPAYGVQAKYKDNGELYLRFTLKNGQILEHDYTEIIHLRQDFNDNDIFGEIFRDLDQLKAGDVIIVYTNQRSYTYVITGWEVVEPTQVEVMAPTNDPTATLISCYPYRVDTQRIVVKARLQEG